MNSDRFKELLDELDGNSLETLKEKNAIYSRNGDCLHNFRSGAQLTRKTPAQTCWGYMSKHLTALLDKVEANDFSDREDFLEKCQDTINYIRFLWCIGNDENSKLFCRDTLGRSIDLEETITEPVCPFDRNGCHHEEGADVGRCLGYNNCTYYKKVILKEK